MVSLRRFGPASFVHFPSFRFDPATRAPTSVPSKVPVLGSKPNGFGATSYQASATRATQAGITVVRVWPNGAAYVADAGQAPYDAIGRVVR